MWHLLSGFLRALVPHGQPELSEPPDDGTEFPCRFHVGRHVRLAPETPAGILAQYRDKELVVTHLAQVLGEPCNCVAHLEDLNGISLPENVLEMELRPVDDGPPSPCER